MSIDERDRRAALRGREGVRRAPRSGGRIAESGRRSTESGGRIAESGRRSKEQRGTGVARRSAAPERSATGVRGQRHYPTDGTTALQLSAAEPVRPVQAAAAPRLRVAPPSPISTPRVPFVAVVIALVVAGVFGILLINTKTNENAFQISRLQEQQSALDNERQQLQKQIAGYDKPGNLDAAARILGLVKSDPPAYIRLPDGKVIGVPKPGSGRPAITAQDAGR